MQAEERSKMEKKVEDVRTWKMDSHERVVVYLPHAWSKAECRDKTFGEGLGVYGRSGSG